MQQSPFPNTQTNRVVKPEQFPGLRHHVGSFRVADNGCWTWAGKQMESAAKFVWELLNDPAPSGQEIFQTCKNPDCVCPYHLDLRSSRFQGGYYSRSSLQSDPILQDPRRKQATRAASVDSDELPALRPAAAKKSKATAESTARADKNAAQQGAVGHEDTTELTAGATAQAASSAAAGSKAAGTKRAPLAPSPLETAADAVAKATRPVDSTNSPAGAAESGDTGADHGRHVEDKTAAPKAAAAKAVSAKAPKSAAKPAEKLSAVETLAPAASEGPSAAPAATQEAADAAKISGPGAPKSAQGKDASKASKPAIVKNNPASATAIPLVAPAADAQAEKAVQPQAKQGKKAKATAVAETAESTEAQAAVGASELAAAPASAAKATAKKKVVAEAPAAPVAAEPSSGPAKSGGKSGGAAKAAAQKDQDKNRDHDKNRGHDKNKDQGVEATVASVPASAGQSGADGETGEVGVCPSGHAMVKDNIYIYPGSGRIDCSICKRLRDQKSRAKIKALKAAGVVRPSRRNAAPRPA